MKYVAPEPFKLSFTCPHCGVLAQHTWWSENWFAGNHTSHSSSNVIRCGYCTHCSKSTLWVYDSMLFPDTGNAPFPNEHMPEAVLKLYSEASSIHMKSPRGAAALLRLAIQVLCEELGEPGKNINTDIAALVKKGLPKIVQQSLDIVRVTGNDAVHPGTIDTDNPEVVGKLFELINVIVEYMISLPNKINGIYSELPEDKVNGINERDKV